MKKLVLTFILSVFCAFSLSMYAQKELKPRVFNLLVNNNPSVKSISFDMINMRVKFGAVQWQPIYDICIKNDFLGIREMATFSLTKNEDAPFFYEIITNEVSNPKYICFISDITVHDAGKETEYKLEKNDEYYDFSIYLGETNFNSVFKSDSKPAYKEYSQPSAPVSNPVSAPVTSQKSAVTPQKQTSTPKPAVTTPQASMTSKEMTLKQMVTQPLGVLSAENVTIRKEEVRNQLAAVDSKWEVLTNTGGQVHVKKYDMTYAGHDMGAYCDFNYKDNSKGRLQSNYTFYFKQEKEAIAFYQSLLSQMKSEGATVTSEKSENSHTHRTNLTCYGFPVMVTQLKAQTNYKYQVRIKVDH